MDVEKHSSFELRLREDQAPHYDSDYAAVHGPWLTVVERELFRRLLRLSRGDILLELGSGTGRLTEGSLRSAPGSSQSIALREVWRY